MTTHDQDRWRLDLAAEPMPRDGGDLYLWLIWHPLFAQPMHARRNSAGEFQTLGDGGWSTWREKDILLIWAWRPDVRGPNK